MSAAAADSKAPALPSDCCFGDGGAYELIEAAQDAQEQAAPQAKPKPSRPPQAVPSLLGHDSFASILAAAERSFSIGDTGSTVKLLDGVTAESKSNIAQVSSSSGVVLGKISTAMPLGTTNGLKAICASHKLKGTPPCQCWIAFPKSRSGTAAERMDMFQSLAEWLATGAECNRETHERASYTLRVAAGMNPRGPRQPR